MLLETCSLRRVPVPGRVEGDERVRWGEGHELESEVRHRAQVEGNSVEREQDEETGVVEKAQDEATEGIAEEIEGIVEARSQERIEARDQRDEQADQDKASSARTACSVFAGHPDRRREPAREGAEERLRCQSARLKSVCLNRLET